ncbi:MAG: pyridoxal-phosphate dependent enzyme [Balneolales bacterium]|nr:pyridoxal-phosphate dependent enzyme [Balneolales bacterium]
MLSESDLKTALNRISPFIHRTPVLTSAFFDKHFDANIFFKCENFQKCGAFKARGAINAVLKLSTHAAVNGVATHSSGNHAAALARAARIRGIDAFIVMPEDAPKTKIDAVKSYGGRITFCKPGIENRELSLQSVLKKTGAAFIPPYNHLDVIEGQASCGVELMEQVPDLDYIIAPVGGGGLLSGIALAVREITYTSKTRPRVVGAEPLQANDAYLSIKSGTRLTHLKPNTIADGLRTTLGPLTFEIIKDNTHAIFCSTEEQIIRYMRLVWERMKIIIEPSCSVPLGVIESQKELFRGKRVGVVLTGGNVDLNRLPWL